MYRKALSIFTVTTLLSMRFFSRVTQYFPAYVHNNDVLPKCTSMSFGLFMIKVFGTLDKARVFDVQKSLHLAHFLYPCFTCLQCPPSCNARVFEVSLTLILLVVSYPPRAVRSSHAFRPLPTELLPTSLIITGVVSTQAFDHAGSRWSLSSKRPAKTGVVGSLGNYGSVDYYCFLGLFWCFGCRCVGLC